MNQHIWGWVVHGMATCNCLCPFKGNERHGQPWSALTGALSFSLYNTEETEIQDSDASNLPKSQFPNAQPEYNPALCVPRCQVCVSISEPLQTGQRKELGKKWREAAVSSYLHQLHLLFSPGFQAPVNWLEFSRKGNLLMDKGSVRLPPPLISVAFCGSVQTD